MAKRTLADVSLIDDMAFWANLVVLDYTIISLKREEQCNQEELCATES
jgi:hypothetical protein